MVFCACQCSVYISIYPYSSIYTLSLIHLLSMRVFTSPAANYFPIIVVDICIEKAAKSPLLYLPPFILIVCVCVYLNIQARHLRKLQAWWGPWRQHAILLSSQVRMCYAMRYYTLLCCTVLSFVILCSAMLYYAVLSKLYCTVLHDTVLWYTILCYIILYRTMLLEWSMYHTKKVTIFGMVMDSSSYTVLYCTTLCYTILYSTGLYYVVHCPVYLNLTQSIKLHLLVMYRCCYTRRVWES